MEKRQAIIPVLRILDEAKAREFYIDWLGFSIDWEHRFGDNFPLYCQISKDHIVIHLSEHYGDCIPGSRIRIEITEIEKYQQQLLQKNYKYYKPGLEEMDWGRTEMALTDPFGNHIIFTEEIKKK
jgi:uncharacterized glyoxalase superfamily protein PhnB